MTLLYASTFTAALRKLPAPGQKQAKLTAFDLQMDPRGNGLQMHRIEKSPGFWSVRVSGDIRIILYKDGETTLLAYVDHHDEAYETERHLLYVACTRPRDRLLVSAVEPGSEFLEDFQVKSRQP
jgi:mRNA-degrading endonuclease RelE of RelBE toxin-antitoxin system